jgi:hypothetical protein
MLPLFRLGLGGKMGSGRQYLSWVHRDDTVGLLLFALEQPELRGPVNVTAPEPVTNADFARALGAALHRPAVLPVPAFALKVAVGEMSEAVLGGQRVLPRRAQEAGYRFQHPDLPEALRSLVG